MFQSCNHYSLPNVPDNIESMSFAIATCPKCSGRFRLVWRIGKKKLPLTSVIRLTCPVCAHGFEQVAVELVVYDAGKEEFPKTVIVEPSALVKA